MPQTALVQTRIDPEIRDRAAIGLERCGLTVSGAVRILLTRVANEGALPPSLVTDPAAHDDWFRTKVRKALDNPDPLSPMRRSRPTSPAVTDRTAIVNDLAAENPPAAMATDAAIARQIETLRQFPNLCRSGRVEASRERALPHLLIKPPAAA